MGCSSLDRSTYSQVRNKLERIQKRFYPNFPDNISYKHLCSASTATATISLLTISGDLSPSSVSREKALRHWRFYMDPPEFQTVLLAEKGEHYGYWRDDPSDKSTFVVSNIVPSCTIKPIAATLFGAVQYVFPQCPLRPKTTTSN